jgi:hypothetical protein
MDTGVQTPPTDEGIKTDLGADEDRNRKGRPFQRLVHDEGGQPHNLCLAYRERDVILRICRQATRYRLVKGPSARKLTYEHPAVHIA